MARLSAQERLDKAKAVKAKAEAEIRSLAARARQDDRKKDTRRKILVGAMFMQAMQHDPRMKEWLRLRVDGLSDRDRSPFDGWDGLASQSEGDP